MEEELIDQVTYYPKGSGKQTIRMLVISVELIATSLIIVFLDFYFQMSEWFMLLAILCGVGAFGVSLSGIFTGFTEKKYSSHWVRTGLVCHFIIVSLPVLFFIINVIDIFLSLNF